MIIIYKRIILCIFLVTFSFTVIGSEIKILYKVNDNIISSYDVEEESNYLKTLNNKLENISNEELTRTAIQSLIREKIKKDEIERFFDINYKSAMQSNSIKNIIKKLYTNLNFESEKDFFDYLKIKNVDPINLKKKFVIEQMWNQLIVNKYNKSIKINENEINEKVDRIISENKEIIVFNLSEIVFRKK